MTYYHVTTRYRRDAGAGVCYGIAYTIERGGCTAEAMRSARDDLADSFGPVEITEQRAHPAIEFWKNRR